MFSCEPVNWAEGVSAIASLLTLLAAVYGVRLWREQLLGTSKHSVAVEASTEVRTLALLFFEARSPMYMAWEFPDEYNAMPVKERTHDNEARAWAHAYQRRWDVVYAQVLKVAQLRGKVGAVLGEDVVEQIEKLARKARMLAWWMEESVRIKRAGPEVVARWTNQDMVRAVPEHLEVGDDQNDNFSREFNSLLKPLLAQLKQYT